MRHLWSLLAGVVVAPVTWLLIAMGQGGSTRTVAGWVDDGRYDTASLIEPAAYLVAAGILLGLLGTLRISPLGPLVAGLLLIGAYAGMFVAPFVVHDNVPGNERIFGRPVPLHLPLDNGTLLLLGVLLVMAAVSVQRWRRWPVTADDAVGDGAAAPATGGDDASGGDEHESPSDLGATPTAPATDETDGAPAAIPTQRGSDEVDPAPLPRRQDSQSPWSTPPRAVAKESSTTE
ncbi:hypothetical protein [Micromonospora sp. NPDC049679]|uniref:hypothetical protein n=1 Tax=Micromonospora sp. NPDC049679 TaxID=3155920 RepID=UPI0033D456AB